MRESRKAGVLLVEDEADIRELIEEAFEERRIDVFGVDSDAGAYAALEAEATRYGVLVADINLGPGTTGFDVARRARTLNPDLKVIYITGHAAHLDRFGVDGAVMFPKPFNPGELADRVRQLLDEGSPTA
ncbi:response regulator transcription factor [Phenylobacterium sp.]|jgi:DNA-binding response OmpR family regulator|uniref:response regulator transcription factor n=1 Tax=Phenylobacterium sp. TaxID=1871053 RepID=UPI003783E0A3